MPPRLKRALRWAGSGLALVAGFTVLWKLGSQAGQLPAGALRGALPGIAGGALAYALAGTLLAVGWWRLVGLCSGGKPDLAHTMATHLVSQVGKYLPGNVAHLAARHTLGRVRGYSHSTLLSAAVLESAVLVAVALGLGVGVAERVIDAGRLPEWLRPLIDGAPVASLAALPLLLWLARRRRWVDAEGAWSRALVELGSIYLLSMAFFLAAAACFSLLLPDTETLHGSTVVAWFAAAWLLGFVLPGAPGGLGVREAVLVLGLAPILGEPQAALGAVLLRIVTLSGDGLMSLAGWLVLRSAESRVA